VLVVALGRRVLSPADAHQADAVDEGAAVLVGDAA
jgi:hypothetical protein